MFYSAKQSHYVQIGYFLCCHNSNTAILFNKFINASFEDFSLADISLAKSQKC